MKQFLLASAAVLWATSAHSAGLDRSGQSIALLFEEGGYVEFSLGLVMPNIGSTSVIVGGQTGNVTQNHILMGGGFRDNINGKLSYALIFDQPYGADISYPTTGSFLVGGTSAFADTFALTGLLRYKLGDRLSLHGGVRAQSIAADVTLSGAAYGILSGYTAEFSRSTAFGFVAGGAYEIADIALRVALTYNSEISHDVGTAETGFFGSVASPTNIVTPQSVNLDFQTGIMAGTLVFGSARWVNWNGFDVTPATLLGVTGSPLVEYTSDYYTTNIGIGRRFNDTWSGAIQVGYEGAAGGLSSPLSPKDGFWSAGVGATYTHANMKITGGVSAVKPGGTTIAIAGTPLAEMDAGIAYAAGVKVGYSF